MVDRLSKFAETSVLKAQDTGRCRVSNLRTPLPKWDFRTSVLPVLKRDTSQNRTPVPNRD